MRRSKFSLSNYKLLSCDLGELVPCGLFEVLPGDTIQMNTNALVRCSPLLAPVMHPVDIRIHHWFVPFRLVWDDFEKFITGGPDGMDNSTFPTVALGSVVVGTLRDYLGLPLSAGALTTSVLPFRCYAQIWNDWYRDQDLQTELVVSRASGADSTTSLLLQNCAWEKDYFTSSRPWEQKGPTITVPLGTQATVRTNSTNLVTGANPVLKMQNVDGTGNPAAQLIGINTVPDVWTSGTGLTSPQKALYPSNLYADLSTASAVTINILREALALQRFEEARARFGSRYVEYLRYLGVKSSDARLQRPEYLGGGRQTVQFSEVLQTAQGSDPVGEMRGHGITAMRSNRFRRFIEEHGYVMSLVSARPKTIYMQGVPRHWNRREKEDFWQKELQHIGQQEILNKELYAAHASPDGTFGFQDRYDEYRREESGVMGEFRTTLLNHWHMARDFASSPALNSTFVSCVPTERTFAVPSEDVLYIMAKHSIQARRLVAPTGSSFIY